MRRTLACAALSFVVAFGCSHAHRNNQPPGGDAGSGACSPEGATQCMGSTFQTCTGGQWSSTDCTTMCDPTLGCVTCAPGTSFCQNGDVYQCDATGNPGSLVQSCTGAQTCANGTCVDACADAAASHSYIGCEYWAVDLHNAIDVIGPPLSLFGCALYGINGLVQENLDICVKSANPNKGQFAGTCDPPATVGGPEQCPSGYACTPNTAACALDAQHSAFAVVVSNPQARDVHVTLAAATGTPIMQTVPAGQVVSIKPQPTITDQPVPGTGQFPIAYKITSDLPIVAYEFNPLDNVNVFSNDASLLLPRTAYDINYWTLSWPTLDRRANAMSDNPFYGYVTVVAWQNGTQVTVTPSAAVVGSSTMAGIASGTATTFTLNAFDVLDLEAAGSGDLSGSFVTSPNSKSFGVFGGHVATAFGESTSPDPANYPMGPCCADHLEHMLFPDSTWGMSFAIARSKQRTNEPDYLRIIAQKPNTAVTFTPAPAVMVAGNCASLAPGQFCDVKIQGDTEVSATQPIEIGHYIESSIWCDATGLSCTGTGDPSMAVAVPVEQYRTDYTILIPNTYDQDYISISAAPTGGVTVDGTAVTLTPFPSPATHRGAIVPLVAGPHTIHCADTCGVLVYGYSNAVSYMYAGGLDLKPIVIQ